MHITITTLQIDIKNKTRNLIEKKINKISKYLEDKESNVDVELSQESGHHKKGNIFKCEINLQDTGKVFRADAIDKSIEAAFMSALKDIEEEVSGGHAKDNTLLRKGARKIKKILRFE